MSHSICCVKKHALKTSWVADIGPGYRSLMFKKTSHTRFLVVREAAFGNSLYFLYNFSVHLKLL